CARGHSNFDCW
nr:immunoglobulin heavy chain junction region [Macaca mulatta]